MPADVQHAVHRPFWTIRRLRSARRIVQLGALSAFLILFFGAREGRLGQLAGLPMQLNPLLMLAQAVASRTLLAASALALITVGITLALGRSWCAWLCPLGTLLDLCQPHRNRRDEPAWPDNWRSLKYVLLMMILAAALLGNLTLLILDPVTIVFRAFTASLWPALDVVVTSAETLLYQIPLFQAAISTFDSLVRPALLPTSSLRYRDVVVHAAILAGVIALGNLSERFWCRYVCPLGGLLGLLSKLSVLRRQVITAQCTECDACVRLCPTGAIQPARGYASDPSECTMCLDCLVACPRNGNVLAVDLSLADWQQYDPGRRQVLVALAASVASVGLLRSDLTSVQKAPHLIRPPGVRENELLAKCIRCSECVRACPTGVLQPAGGSSAEGLWTPALVARAGYCDYACNACGQVCPVAAIPPLSLEEKRRQVIGTAYIDRNRCIAWADHRDCIVCEEMCPVPDKAVWLEPTQVQGQDGRVFVVQMPHMLRDQCIGCGICEYKCPVKGDAAIRVYLPLSTPL